MSILQNLKNIFLPSEEVARQRRISTFGTESKTFATAAVVAGAATLIAAPALVASAGGAKVAAGKVASAVGGGVKSGWKQTPLLGKAAIVAVAPSVTGAVVAQPSIVTDLGKTWLKSAGQGANLANDINKLASAPNKENLIDFVSQHKLATGVAGGALVLAAGAAGKMALNSFAAINLSSAAKSLEKAADKGTTTLTDNLPPVNQSVLGAQPGATSTPSVAGNTTLAAPVANSDNKTPIIPASKGSIRGVKRRKKAKEQPRMTQNVRVNVIDDRDVADRKVYKSRSQRY